jgi:hypothetical protein
MVDTRSVVLVETRGNPVEIPGACFENLAPRLVNSIRADRHAD